MWQADRRIWRHDCRLHSTVQYNALHWWEIKYKYLVTCVLVTGICTWVFPFRNDSFTNYIWNTNILYSLPVLFSTEEVKKKDVNESQPGLRHWGLKPENRRQQWPGRIWTREHYRWWCNRLERQDTVQYSPSMALFKKWFVCIVLWHSKKNRHIRILNAAEELTLTKHILLRCVFPLSCKNVTTIFISHKKKKKLTKWAEPFSHCLPSDKKGAQWKAITESVVLPLPNTQCPFTCCKQNDVWT